MKFQVVYGQMPSSHIEVEFMLPYTHYSPPNFDVPEFIFEVRWFKGNKMVISKFIYTDLETCKKEFEHQKIKWYGKNKNIIDKVLDKEIRNIQKAAHESRLNYKRAERILKEFYPIGLREYMERMRRMNYVKAKRKREKMKIMSMIPEDAENYINKKMENMKVS